MVRPSDEYLSFRDTVQVVTEFLETAFHTILYLRTVYPPEMFQKVQKYGVPVWQSRAPALREYIGRITEMVGEELAKGTVTNVVLVMMEASTPEKPSERKPLERFVFTLTWLLPPSEMPEPGSDMIPSNEGLPKSAIDHHFRSFIIDLFASPSKLLSLPPDITFTVLVEMVDDATTPQSEAAKKQLVPAEWIPAEARQASGKSTDAPNTRRSSHPLTASRLGLLNLQMNVEELEDKYPSETISPESTRSASRADKGKGREGAW